MNWESLLASGVGLIRAGLGGYGGYVRLSTRFDGHRTESDRRFKDSEDDRKDLRLRIEAVDREAVRKADLATVKIENIARVKEVEHTFRNEQAKSVGELREMVGKRLDRALGARS